MRGRNGVAWFMLACGLFAVAGGAEGAPGRARVDWPTMGGALYYKGTFEVTLEGLSQTQFDSLSVRMVAQTVSGANVLGPICLWEGWPEVPVVAGSSAEGSAWKGWADREGGRAWLRVQWNYFPPGFRSGDYLVRVEVLVRSPGGRSDRWGNTEWHLVHLIPEQSPTLPVSLRCPVPSAEFGLDEPVAVAGLAAGAKPPIWARLEIRRGDAVGRWELVEQKQVNSAQFQFEKLCLAPQETLGLHHLRVIVVDSHGASGVAEVPIVLIRRPLQVRLTHPEAGAQVVSGEAGAVRGQVLGAAFPVRVCLEVRREVDPARWEPVSEATLVAPMLELSWDTGRLTSGTWYLRATARDSQGLSATSNEVKVIVREPKFVIQVAKEPPDAIEPLKERDRVRFRLDAEGTWTRFAWDFGDGKSSDQEAPVHTYGQAGTYRVCVTACSPTACSPSGSSRTTCTDVVVARREVLVATRKIIGYPRSTDCAGVAALLYVSQSDSTGVKAFPVRVEVHIRILEEVSAILLTEQLPDQWDFQSVPSETDDRGPVTVNGIPNGPKYSWVITPKAQVPLGAGTVVKVEYLLTPKRLAGYTPVKIDGQVYAQVGLDFTYRGEVGGASQVFVERQLVPFVALLFLKKGSDGEYGLEVPWTNPDRKLREEQLGIALHLMTKGEEVPYTYVRLKPEDYLKLVAYYLANRPVVDCPK